MDLRKTTEDLAGAYKAWKEAEAKKEDLRKAFFDLASTQQQSVPTKTVFVEEEPLVANLWASKAYPAWKVVDFREVEGGTEVMLEGRPEYQNFTFIHPELGMVFQKSIRAGTVTLDDDRMKERDEDFYLEVTEEIVERKLRPLDQLTPTQVEKLQGYLCEGKPRVTLSAPRKAKDEELEDAQAD